MVNKIKLLAILFVFAMQSMTAWSATLNASSVHLHKYTSNNEFPKPSKAPSKNPFALSVVLDDESQQLDFTDNSGNSYTYYIYDEDGGTVMQGILDFSNSENCSVDLSGCPSGTYTLAVMYGGNTYMGTFEL